MKRIIDESIERVRHILEVRREALTALTERLIEVESVDSIELKTIIDENSPGPLVVPGTDATNRPAAEQREDTPRSDSGDEPRVAN